MKKIVVTQDVGLTAAQKVKLNTLGEVEYFDTIPSSQQERLNRVEGADIIYSEETFMHENLPHIKNCFLTFPFTAFLQKVDTEQLKVNSVVTSSAVGGNKYAVAERNVTALLILTRNMALMQKATEKISRLTLSSITGIRDQHILILGKGNIGKVTGDLCEKLGGIVDYFTRGDDLKQKVQGKKVIINCLRLNKETEGLINADSLSGFDGFYVTAAECGTENQEDIIALLKSKILQGYARDGGVDKVPGGDAGNKSYQSFKQDLEGYNVFITPHIARSTTNAITYSNDICIESIEAYLLGNPINLLY